MTALPHTQPLTSAEAERLAVDGCHPSWRAAPTTPEEVADVLRAATAGGLAVAPRGAATGLGLGAPPARLDVALDLSKLSGLVQYRPEDLTAVALAGTPLAALQEIFAREGQWLALDPPYAARATLGGVLAVDDSGPHRLRYGTARNLVLGMQVAHSDGRLARSGARVVKSVAGYNVHKLHIGALGTLGVIVEVALRLHPLPRARAVVACRVTRLEESAPIVERLLRQPLGLGAVDLLNGRAAERLWRQAGCPVPDTPGPTLIVLCQGHPPVVQRQIQEVTQAAAGAGVTVIDDDATARGLAQALAALAERDDEADLVPALSVPPAQTAAATAELAATIAATGAEARVLAHAGSGVVRAIVSGESLAGASLEPALAADAATVRSIGTTRPAAGQASMAATLVARARALARARRGHLVVRHCSLEAKHGLDVWGPAAAPELMRRVKLALDPASTLNPGRFVEGI